MSRLEVPLSGATLWHTGDLVLRAYLELRLKDAAGNWHRHTLWVDSGRSFWNSSRA
jgi:hypothetical protein